VIPRIPEPELMDDAEQARAYAEADFAEPHEAFVAHFRARFPDFEKGQVLDLGCGPADVTVRFARAYPRCGITALDGAAAMLAWARRRLEEESLTGRVRLAEVRLPAALPGGFDAVISNSLLHHLADPMVLWQSMRAAGRPGACGFVMDLMRPSSPAAAQELVARHCGAAPPVLRRDFENSLFAAYTPEEVAAQLKQAGLDDWRVEVVSDRHWVAWGRLSPAKGS
jgi:SAM-dependent methyltransferase